MPISLLRLQAVLTACGVVTALLWAGVTCAGVEVFTLAGEPVVNAPDTAVVIELDAPARLDARLSQGLPDDPDRAQQVLQSRMGGPDWQAIVQRYNRAYTGLARAWMLGVEEVPAVVVDGQYVVYGEHDVAAALAEIEQAREGGQ